MTRLYHCTVICSLFLYESPLKLQRHAQFHTKIPSHIIYTLTPCSIIHCCIFQPAQVILVSYIAKVHSTQVDAEQGFSPAHDIRAHRYAHQPVAAGSSFGIKTSKGFILLEGVITFKAYIQVAE